MRGVILAGGNGTRLDPLTRVANKHLLPVYDQPMIHLPIKTLRDYGADEILIVTGGEHIGGFVSLLGDGRHLGVELTYRVQNEAMGVADALKQAEGYTDGLFPVILGDNYFDIVPERVNTPSIYVTSVIDPERFGVYQNDKIVEKPRTPESNLAVVGFYVYDDRVYKYLKNIRPSDRGELEITDINNMYLEEGAEVKPYFDYWRDMGTFETLMEVANVLQS